MQFTIKQARVHSGMTQKQMADQLGIDRSTYLRLEKDVSRATVGQVNKIAEVTGIAVADIFLGANSTLVEQEERRAYDAKRNRRFPADS